VASAVATVVLATATALTWPGGADRSAPTASAVDIGRALFAAKGCVACHTGPGTGGAVAGGISLADVPSRVPGMSRAEYVRQSILAPGAVVAPTAGEIGPFAMPALVVNAREVDALVGYLVR
jgi:mono/diheme cytochrome c family protein